MAMSDYKIVLLALVLWSIAGGNVMAQDGQLEKLHLNAALYRGPVVMDYPLPFKGTVYVFSDDFILGDVEYNEKLYKGAMLNLDSYRGDLCVKLPGSGMALVLDRNLVSCFTLGDKMFIHTGDDKSVMPEDYYQVLYDGKDQLLKKVEKHFFMKEGVSLEVYEKDRYYVVKDGKYYKLKKEKHLKRLYPHMRKTIYRTTSALRRIHDDKDKIFALVMEKIEKSQEGTL